jgi:hypothetical protein
MSRLAREIAAFSIWEFGTQKFLARLCDPFWFQAFGCVLGFDWHSSGVTTTVCGALKEGLKGREKEFGFFVCGGKGAASRKTPDEIETICERIALDPLPLVYASRMSAKVDTAAVQDSYQIYHHCFFFTTDGHWCVVQQGLNESTQLARRYHWLGSSVRDFVCEPHSAICCDSRSETLNMVAQESESARKASVIATTEKPETLVTELGSFPVLTMPAHHEIRPEDFRSKYLSKILTKVHEVGPQNFENLLAISGVGPKTIRALALVSEVIYGEKPSFRDPARFSFAHGGKDGTPYPVDRKVYDFTIEFLSKSLNKAQIGGSERREAFARLTNFFATQGLSTKQKKQI